MTKYLRYVEFNCSIELYNEYEEYFSKINNYISRIYEFYVCPISSIGITKIIVSIRENIGHIKIELTSIQVCFDRIYFESLTELEKLEYIQSLYFKSIEFIANKEKWKDANKLNEKHQNILNKKLIFRDYFKKSKASPNRKFKAQLYFEYNYQNKGAYIMVISKNKQKKIMFSPNSYIFFCGSVKSFIWIDNEQIKIPYYNNRDYWIINIVTGKVDFHYPRIEKKDGHSYYDLALLYLQGSLIFKNDEKALYYLEKSVELNHKRAIRKLKEITGANNV